MADVHVVPSEEVWSLQVDGEKRDTRATSTAKPGLAPATET
jgi:hypothetical protein